MLLFGLAFRKNLLRKFFMPLFAITDRGWHILPFAGHFFLVSSALNEVVRHWVTPEVWVHYKIGNTLALISFGLYQLRLTGRERPHHGSRSVQYAAHSGEAAIPVMGDGREGISLSNYLKSPIVLQKWFWLRKTLRSRRYSPVAFLRLHFAQSHILT
ncbi:MAG: septation protein IspZ [Candidatus Moraniibacteriota bacterium]|nr:MAG: septation protein IspZ [Candidatus Moranbacteria bacterium]